MKTETKSSILEVVWPVLPSPLNPKNHVYNFYFLKCPEKKTRTENVHSKFVINSNNIFVTVLFNEIISKIVEVLKLPLENIFSNAL